MTLVFLLLHEARFSFHKLCPTSPPPQHLCHLFSQNAEAVPPPHTF